MSKFYERPLTDDFCHISIRVSEEKNKCEKLMDDKNSNGL